MYHFCLFQNLENYTVLVAEVTDNWDMATVRYTIFLFIFAFNLSVFPMRGIYQNVVQVKKGTFGRLQHGGLTDIFH